MSTKYIVRDSLGNWMATYDEGTWPDALAWAKQCAKRSEGVVTREDASSDQMTIVHSFKSKSKTV